MTNPFQPIDVYSYREYPKSSKSNSKKKKKNQHKKKSTEEQQEDEQEDDDDDYQNQQQNPVIFSKILNIPKDQSKASEKTKGKFPILVEVFAFFNFFFEEFFDTKSF